MPLEVVLMLCDARAKMSRRADRGRGGASTDGGWTDRPGGGRQMHITSMSQLGAFLGGGVKR